MKHGSKKLSVIQRRGFVDDVATHRANGQQDPVETLPGSHERVDLDSHGDATLKTTGGGVTSSLNRSWLRAARAPWRRSSPRAMGRHTVRPAHA